MLCTKLLVGSLFATSNAGEEFLRNLEKFEFATSKLEWVIDDFKDNKNDSHPMVVENVGDLLDELDTHVSGIADACKALADYWVGASSTTISDELNAEGELLAPVQGLVDFLYNQYQCLVERKSAPYLNIDWTIMPQPEVDAEDLLGKISEHIASIPAKVAELIDEIVRVNNHNINNLIFGIDISKLSAEIANLKTVFTQKPLDANADINTAVLGVLDTASSSLDELQFEHRACLAEYIGSLARVECVTSAICSQIQKIISFNFGEPKNIDTIVECIVEITSHVEEIKDSMAKTNEIFDTNECIIHPAFIKELREMYDHVFGCFSEIEKIYYNYTETPSGVTVLAENVHHTVGDVSDIMGRIIDNVESMVNHIPAIFEGFSQNYIQEIGVELVKLDASLTSLGGQCAGSDTSLLSALPAGVCCPHKNIKISDFLINIATLLNGFPPIDTTLCCSHIFNEMHNIYHCCFKTLRLLETVFNADEMYFANKHSAWRNILSLIQEFIVKITETGSINGRPTPDDGKCYGVNLKVYLQTVCAEFEEMTDNLDEHIQSLNLPNFVPYFRTTYTDKGCRTLTFFLTGIGEIVEKIEELFPTFIEKIEVSSYAVDANLKGLVISTSQALENFVGQVGDEIGKKIPMLSTLCSKCDDGVWALIKTNLLDLVTLAQKIANEQLSTPRCCRDPGQILLNTGQTLFKIDQVIQRIGIETSCISSDDATILISNVDRGTEILSCILNQVSAMQSSGGDSACFLQRKIQNISEIDTQVQNLLDVALKVHEVFGGTPFAFEVAPFDPYDDKGSSAPDPNLCDYFDDIVEFVSTHLTGIGSHISEFNESLLARDRAFYSDELLASITAFVGEFFKISKQINSVHEYVESNLIITCGNHSPFFSEEIASIYGELVKIPVS
ncbi:MAG: hypothetical protein LBQ43_01715, partial [Holosporales bacterium]|nr:hypothetical protein [Holosporales bacterium]